MGREKRKIGSSDVGGGMAGVSLHAFIGPTALERAARSRAMSKTILRKSFEKRLRRALSDINVILTRLTNDAK